MGPGRWKLVQAEGGRVPGGRPGGRRDLVRVGIAALLLSVSLLPSLGARFLLDHGLREGVPPGLGGASALVPVPEPVAGGAFDLAGVGWTAFPGAGAPETRAVRARRAPVAGLPAPYDLTAAYDLNRLLDRARMVASGWREARDSLERARERLEATPSIRPAPGFISSAFSRRRWHPILNRPRPHEGIDIAAPEGAPILAAAAGRVRSVGWSREYGLLVEIDHGYGIVTRYAHASRVVVREGQRVARGQKIAEVGETGLAVGPHLHYEVLVRGRPVNPKRFLFDDAAHAAR